MFCTSIVLFLRIKILDLDLPTLSSEKLFSIIIAMNKIQLPGADRYADLFFCPCATIESTTPKVVGTNIDRWFFDITFQK